MLTTTQTKKGMVLDINASNLDGTFYPFALNAAVESNSQEGNLYSIQNEGSNILAVNFPEGFQVIGRRRVHEQNRTLYFLVNPSTGISQIGEVLGCNYDDDRDDIRGFSTCSTCLFEEEKEKIPLEEFGQTPFCTYSTIVSSDCLNFNIDFPVKIRYKITDCGINIYFTDGLNQRRFIYFDYVDNIPTNHLVLNDRFKIITGYEIECEVPIYGNELDCNKINYHPSYNIPCIDFEEVVSGGVLKAGVYQFIIGYGDVNGNILSDYFSATNPIPIFSKEITVETNYTTSKSIALKITNLDQNGVFGYYNLVVAETIDNFTTFKLVGTFPTTQKEITYTGTETDLIKLTPDDIFSKRVYYNTAGGIADSNSVLFFSNLEEFSKPNLQRVANSIQLYWKTIAVPENLYRDPKNTVRFRGYLRDEVYPMGIIFVKKTGEEIGPFHIPGPSKNKFFMNYGINVDAVVSNDDVLTDTSCNNITRNKTWQVYNTGRKIGTPHEDSPTCDDNKTWEWGEFAYWESIKTYPNNPDIWGDLCGQPIRYHKFPDSNVTHIHDGLNGAKVFTDANIVYPIGVRVDHQSVITALSSAVVDGVILQSEVDELEGYRIIRGNRVGHKSIHAKGMLFDMWSYVKNGVSYYYPNYAYNDLRQDKFISNNPNTYQGGNNSNPIPNDFFPSRRYTFHSPDTHFNNPALGTEIKLETEEYGTSEGYFNLADEQAKYKFLSTFARTFAFAAGVAAAFSAEKEKECKTVVTKSMQAITATFPGALLTTPAIPVGQFLPVLPPQSFLYEDFTGLSIGLGGTDPINPLMVTEVHRQTCRGKTFQLLNPASGNPAAIFGQQLVYLGVIGLREMDIIVQLVKALSPYKNFAVQYNSVGRYNNYKIVANSGNKIRKIERSAYLEPIIQLISESVSGSGSQFTNVYINNWNRERSAYLKTDVTKPRFPNPTTTDNSRTTLDDAGLNQEDLYKRIYRTVSSYYCSLKDFVPDQYGDITDIKYLETGKCLFRLDEDYTTSQDGLYGGDTFINRFGLKRKMPFFLQTRFRFNNDSDIKYSDLGNAGFPNYYFNVEEPLFERFSGNTFGGDLFGVLTEILGVANTRLDAKKQKVFYQSGFIHLYNYGIPYFLAESDVNVDYRHGENNKEKDFYPHQQDLDFWLQEKNVPITEDNYYFYNTTYSKQNKENVIGVEKLDITRECKTVFPSRIIQSDVAYNDSNFDNWLIFRANNMYEAPSSFGRIIGLDGIENDKVLVRYENKFQVFNAYDVLTVGDKDVQVGNGGIFKTRPKEFVSVDLGYAGSQHSEMKSTEFGHIWTDAKRGQVFNLNSNASGLDELAKEGMRNWFKENLPFQIFKDFPTIDLKDIDNNYKGIGITMSFDKRFSRLFITKLDYKKINPCVTYNTETKKFEADGEEVQLCDKRYFCDKSWTVSYNLATKSWVSFHSFLPNFYIDDVDSIQSGVNRSTVSSVWSHNVTNKSFQVYYGKLYPFVIETLADPQLLSSVLNSVEFDTDVLRYHNLYDYVYNRLVTFNKVIVYNDRQCSGLLELIPRKENNLYENLQYPKVTNTGIEVLVTNKDNKWRFNQFFDAVNSQTANLPFFKNKCNNADKELYINAFNYNKPDIHKQPIRAKNSRIRFINDAKSNYKFIFNFSQNDITPNKP